jgi:hypothetical protein
MERLRTSTRRKAVQYSNLDPGQNGADQRSSWPAIEASDFWASRDTQEFVGVAPVAHGSPSPIGGRYRSVYLTLPPVELPVSPGLIAWFGGAKRPC